MLPFGCDRTEVLRFTFTRSPFTPHAAPMFMTRVGVPWITVSLQWVALVLVSAVLVTAWVFRSKAPAVSIGPLGCIAGGDVGFLAGASNGPRNAPAAAALASSAGLVVLGIVGLFATKRRATRPA